MITSALGSWCAIKMQQGKRKCNKGKHFEDAWSHSTQQFRENDLTRVYIKKNVIHYNNLQRKNTSGRASMHKNNDYTKAGKTEFWAKIKNNKQYHINIILYPHLGSQHLHLLSITHFVGLGLYRATTNTSRPPSLRFMDPTRWHLPPAYCRGANCTVQSII